MSSADRELARRMLAGDEPAFHEFFDGHFGRLYRFALSRVQQNEDAAEEVAQATICKAITKLATYRGEAALFTWLCTFCRHEIWAYRKRNRMAVQQVDLLEEIPEVRAALESLAAETSNPEAALDRNMLRRLVQVTLDHLPARYATVLEWKYLEEVPVVVIAERLELSPKAAESLLTRSREAFRDGFRTLTGASVSLISRRGCREIPT